MKAERGMSPQVTRRGEMNQGRRQTEGVVRRLTQISQILGETGVRRTGGRTSRTAEYAEYADADERAVEFAARRGAGKHTKRGVPDEAARPQRPSESSVVEGIACSGDDGKDR